MIARERKGDSNMKIKANSLEKTDQQLHNFFAIENQRDYSAHLQHTVAAVRSVYQVSPRRHHISFPLLVLKQLRFVALKIWLVQGMVLSALCSLFLFYYDTHVISFNEYIPRGILALCGCIIVLSARPLLLRPIRYRMLEIEQSTYFSNRGGILAQLLFIGIGDIGMLSVLTFLAINCQIEADTVFLFLVIPFLTAAAAGLMLWVRTSSSLFQKAWILVCIFSSLLICETVKRSLVFSRIRPLILWSSYALICVCILCRECRELYLQENLENML